MTAPPYLNRSPWHSRRHPHQLPEDLVTDNSPATTGATFWCWTEGEPSTFRCRERGHDVRESSPGGLTARQPGFAVTLTDAWVALKNENTELLAKLDRQRVDADLARRDLKRVSDWHSPSPHEDEEGLCGGCGGHWPCHTRQILDGHLNPAYMTARCGQLSVHAPHISDTGPDRPRNCPGVPVPPDGHTAGCVAGRDCEPYCDSHPTRIARKTFRVEP